MIIALFGSWIVGVILLYWAQKRQKSSERWILIIIATLCFIWPIISHYALKPVNPSLSQSQTQEAETNLQENSNQSVVTKHFFFDYDCKLSDKAKTGVTYKIWWSDKIYPGDINNFFPDGTHIQNETYGSGYVGADEYALKSPIFICSSYPHLNVIINEYCLFVPEKDKLGYIRVAIYEEKNDLGDKIPYLCIEE
jgi:hypothetical protein